MCQPTVMTCFRTLTACFYAQTVVTWRIWTLTSVSSMMIYVLSPKLRHQLGHVGACHHDQFYIYTDTSSFKPHASQCIPKKIKSIYKNRTFCLFDRLRVGRPNDWNAGRNANLEFGWNADRLNWQPYVRFSQNVQGFGGLSLGYPVQNMKGIWQPNFWGKGGKLNLWIMRRRSCLSPHQQKAYDTTS